MYYTKALTFQWFCRYTESGDVQFLNYKINVQQLTVHKNVNLMMNLLRYLLYGMCTSQLADAKQKNRFFYMATGSLNRIQRKK